MLSPDFETSSVRMEPIFLVSVQAPEEDVERIMEHVMRVAPLVMGKYDSNAFQSAAGIERYRPLAGAAAGAENEVRKRPGVIELTIQMPKEQVLLQEVIETVFQVHSYEEPVIVVREALASRSKGLGDKDNPHRWWNAAGDWKKAKQPK
jgi:hypothetical protein